MTQRQLQWGVLGTGAIAHDFATALRDSQRCRAVHVTSASGRAAGFASEFGIARASESLDQLLGDAQVQAVYIASPHPLHEQQALAAIAAGKHVLVEKPMATSAVGAERIIAAARAYRVFAMEAYMYRCHPLITEVIGRVRTGAIGQLRHVRATFGFRAPRDPASRLFAPELGGGGILDVGGYPVSLVRLLAGVAMGKPYAEPTELSALGQIGPTGVDELAQASLRFDAGVTAEVACAVHYELGTNVTLFGDEGRLRIDDPWLPGGKRHGRESHFIVERDGDSPQTVTVGIPRAIYALEAELVADSLPALEPLWPAMTWADSIANQRVLDRWRSALGLPAL
jgi:predicted dehydrogenase